MPEEGASYEEKIQYFYTLYSVLSGRKANIQ